MTNELTEAEIEAMTIFDRLRMVRCALERMSDAESSRKIEIDGKDYESRDLAESMLVCDLKRFEELVDVQDPLYASFIAEIYELPNIDNGMKAYNDRKAAASA